MKLSNLRKEVKKENKVRLLKNIEAIKNLTSEDMKKDYGVFRNYATKTIFKKFQAGEITEKEAKKKTIEHTKKEALKSLNKDLNKILAVEEAKSVYSVDIYIDWKKSQTWGWCPRAYIQVYSLDNNNNHDYEQLEGYASGCGYDKLSTSIASALNGSNAVLKLLYEAEEKRLRNIKKGNNQTRRDFIGYGSGYGIMPYFEGGVGFESQYTIFKKLGYNIKITRDKQGDIIAASIE